MATATITTRRTSSGPRYVVRYRLCGRAFPLIHGGSFRTLRDARARRDLVTSEIAAGRNPAELLGAMLSPAPKVTTASYFEVWKQSRLDLDPRTLANCDFHWKRLEPAFGELAPEEITYTHVQEWIADNARGERPLTPKVLRDYVGTLKQVLDFAGLEANPARDHRVRFPTAEQPTHTPPTDAHVLAMLEHMPRERRLLFVFLEQDGGRIGEHVAFTWGDVDVDGSKILARADVVKGRRGRRKPRWVQVPGWLMDLLLDTCPPEDRAPERPLFPWLRSVQHPIQAANKTMRTACAVAGIPHYHPHDLRHRRLSLWHGQGIPAREIGDRAGQRQIAVTLDVYTHTMPLDEVGESAFRAVLRA